MRDLAEHILDIVQNSLVANAKTINIVWEENSKDRKLAITIIDDGRGMDKEHVMKVRDPFYTSRTSRKVGLGIPFLIQSAQITGGDVSIESTLGVGTQIDVWFNIDSIDMIAIGDLPLTLMTLLLDTDQVRFTFTYYYDSYSFIFDSKSLSEVLEGLCLSDPKVMLWVREYLRSNIKR